MFVLKQHIASYFHPLNDWCWHKTLCGSTNVALMPSFRPKLMWRLGQQFDVWKSQWSGKTHFSLQPIPYILDILCIAWSMLLIVSFCSSSNWTSTRVRSPLSSSCTPSSLQKSLVWVWWPDVAREAPQLDCAAFGPKLSECSLHL